MKTHAPEPNPEATRPARRRTFTAEYKRRILAETEQAGAGQVGAILRREGLYSSHLTHWRREQASGAFTPTPRKRGPKAAQTPEEKELERLKRENAALRKELEKAQLIIDVQKKIARLLGPSEPETEPRKRP